VGVVALALWQALVSWKILDAFFVSRPSDIAQRIGQWITTGIWGHLAATLEERSSPVVGGAGL
jgi:NitT/TauT family transport system permease protein